jgi:hypothetical protein
MDWTRTKARFAFLAEAFNGEGGFAPNIKWQGQADGKTGPTVSGPCYLVPYVRESVEKYAARAACAVYENHLREACERFVGYLGRKRPQREGIEAPLVDLLLQDCDLRGTPLDAFFGSLSLDCKARGSMLVLLDMPPDIEGPPVSLAAQVARRAVPFLTAIDPERLEEWKTDAHGLFTHVGIADCEEVDGKPEKVVRHWDASDWWVMFKDQELRRGQHPFGQCPVLALTESNRPFPVIGKYAQIADLSKRLFNARSERDEILRSQTFSLLCLQIPPEHAATWDAAQATATVGTSSMLVHTGEMPGFIAPPDGPATVYANTIQELEEAIRRVGQDFSSQETAQQESGVARRLRFEQLNADLANYAQGLQGLESRVWVLFHKALGTKNGTKATWPTDYNLTDTQAELDILSGMQLGGMPEQVLAQKKKAIVAAEFDNADEDDKQAMVDAIDQQALVGQSGAPGTPGAPGSRQPGGAAA